MRSRSVEPQLKQSIAEKLTSATGPVIVVLKRPPKPSIVFDSYWHFASERQNIFMRRVKGAPGPWTSDPILRDYKFTNAYRAADRVSQYLIGNVIYRRPLDLRDTVFRILLFKIFNKIDTWRLLEETAGDLLESTFSVDRFDRVLSASMKAGASIYSAAYIMPSGPAEIRRDRKHRMHLELLRTMLRVGFPEQLAATRSMADAYALLHSLPSIGPFLAYQFVTDFNYSDHFHFSEMEFVVPGPGARDGLKKCFHDFGDYSEAELIRWVAERQEQEFAARGLKFDSLWGRPLQLIDCQNVFCEISKYARVAHPEMLGLSGRTRIKQRFAPTGDIPAPWFPPKWGLNECIKPSTAKRLTVDGL